MVGYGFWLKENYDFGFHAEKKKNKTFCCITNFFLYTVLKSDLN